MNFHFGLCHKPIPILKAMKLPRAKAAHNEECNKLKRLLVWDEKKVKTKLVVVRRAMKGGKTVHFEECRPWSSAERRTRKAQSACSAPCGRCQGRMRTQGRVRRARCFSVTDGSGSSSWTRSQSFLVRLDRLVMLFFSIHSSQDGPRSQVVEIATSYECADGRDAQISDGCFRGEQCESRCVHHQEPNVMEFDVYTSWT